MSKSVITVLRSFEKELMPKEYNLLVRFMNANNITTLEGLKDVSVWDFEHNKAFASRITTKMVESYQRAFRKIFNVNFAFIYLYNNVVMYN